MIYTKIRFFRQFFLWLYSRFTNQDLSFEFRKRYQGLQGIKLGFKKIYKNKEEHTHTQVIW